MKKSIPADDNILVKNARLAVTTELLRKRACGLPVSKMDRETGLVYLEYPDGRTQEIGYAMQNGSYGERHREEA